MMNNEGIISIVKAMTELEFESFFEELADHIRDQKWDHIAEAHFNAHEETFEDVADAISGVRSDLEEGLSSLNDIQKVVRKIQNGTK
jgi:predicted dehydrogenase